MVKRGGKEIKTVEIYEETYKYYKKKAEENRYDIKEIINELLDDLIKKEMFLSRIAPFLSVESTELDKMILKDSKKREFIDIFLKDCVLYCDKDKKTDCIHTRFAWAIPEMAKMNLKKQ